MKSFVLIFIFLLNIFAFADESIITIETLDIFDSLGYDKNEIAVLKAGDFGEGGGGNRPIKGVNEEGEGIFEEELLLYYPKYYQVEVQKIAIQTLKKINLSSIQVINFVTNEGKTKVKMDEVYSFELEFIEEVDFNSLTVEKISTILSKSGVEYNFSEIESIELVAIIEP